MIVYPSKSFQIELPDNIQEDEDGFVSSYWINGSSLLLQFSSFVRTEGLQIGARERLRQYTNSNPAKWCGVKEPLCLNGNVDQAAAEHQDNQAFWLHAFLVWPHLAVHSTISGPFAEVKAQHTWARQALKTLSLVIH